MINKDSIYKIIIIGLAIVILFLKMCNDGPGRLDKEVVTVTTIDSILVKGKTDTVKIYFPPQTIEVVKEKIVYIDKKDPKDSLQSWRVYQSPIEDSLISGTIFSEIKLNDCSMLKQYIEYTPKFPKYIKRTDTLKINTVTTITEIEKKNRIFLGGFVGGNSSSFGAGPQVSLTTKKDLLINYNYDVLNKNHNIGFGFKILKW